MSGSSPPSRPGPALSGGAPPGPPRRPGPGRSTGPPRGRRRAPACGARPARRRSGSVPRASPYWRSTLSWVRRWATSASRASVGSATTTQPNGRDISVVRVDSNRVGCFGSSGSGSRRPFSGGAWRPGHGVHTRSARSASQSSPISTPRAPPGNSSGCGPVGTTSIGETAARRGDRGGVSGPALVISSSGAPDPRDNQPMTKGRSRCAADSTAGSTFTKSHSADDVREGAVIAWIRYHGPLRGNGCAMTTPLCQCFHGPLPIMVTHPR